MDSDKAKTYTERLEFNGTVAGKICSLSMPIIKKSNKYFSVINNFIRSHVRLLNVNIIIYTGSNLRCCA